MSPVNVCTRMLALPSAKVPLSDRGPRSLVAHRSFALDGEVDANPPAECVGFELEPGLFGHRQADVTRVRFMS